MYFFVYLFFAVMYCVESSIVLQDEQMAFIPSISLPSNAISMGFKRRFGPSDKLRWGLSLSLSTSLVHLYGIWAIQSIFRDGVGGLALQSRES